MSSTATQIYTIPRFYEGVKQKNMPPLFRLVGRWLSPQSLEGQGKIIELEEPVMTLYEVGEQVLLEVRSYEVSPEKKIKVLSAEVIEVLKKAEDTYPIATPIPLEFEQFLKDVDSFFVSKGLASIQTPSLVLCGAMEASLTPLNVQMSLRKARKQLITSPELHLKKLLSMGLTDIFEITKCYRDEECSPVHSTEFHMLEWYRAYADLNFIQSDLQNFFHALFEMGWIKGLQLSEEIVFEKISVAELFEKYTELILTPQTSLKELRGYILKKGWVTGVETWTWGDCFHLVFLNEVEPNLNRKHPVLVHSYPPQEAALAQVSQEGWAQRFELYWRGVEIANAYNELRDVDEQKKRFEIENQKLEAIGRQQHPQDNTFFKALERGLPPCGGIAVGLERLFMAAQGISRIKELSYFD